MTSATDAPASIPARGWAKFSVSEPFKLFEFERRALKDDDVLIRIHYCGICHTDIHAVENSWNNTNYPIVPGHELTGIVEQIGAKVKRFQVGDSVGVGCMVDSCRTCTRCSYKYTPRRFMLYSIITIYLILRSNGFRAIL